MLTSRHTGPLALLTLIVGAITVAQALLIEWLPPAYSPQADRVDTMMWVLFWASAVIFVGVTVALLYSVWAFRAEPGDESDGDHIHGNTRLEIIWTIIPAVLLAVVAVYAIIVMDRNEELADDRVTIEVVAEQFAWNFIYPELGVETGDLRMPVDRQVELKMRASDVIHSFWINETRVKQDLVPGITTDLVFTIDEPGTYPIICTELCGAGHGVMRSRAVVMDQEAYDAWSASAKSKAATLASAPAAAETDDAEQSQEG